MKHTIDIDPVTLEILWARLIAITDESAVTLVRTAFSTGVRESNDFACVLMDAWANSLVENRGSIPSFCGCISRTAKEFLKRFPPETLLPGDAIITNDPWLATGHLPDMTVVSPIFYRGRLVAFAGSVAHNPDVGGAGWAADCSEVYEEGIRIPPTKILKAGQLNDDVIEILRANSRIPGECVGDILAQVACCEVTALRLAELMEDQGIESLDEISTALQDRAERSMRQAIGRIDDGVYRSRVPLDGFDAPLELVCAINVRGEEMTIDFTGSSPSVKRGINCVYNYTWAYTTYPLKCVIDPTVPRNEGTFRTVKVVAPEGSILNATFPAPVNGRHLVGHVISTNVFTALGQVIPDQVISDSGSTPGFRTSYSGTGKEGDRFHFILFANGGMGARPTDDGLACTHFPSNTAAASIEVMENLTPIVVWTKQLVPDSGGAGTWRGGDGQEMIMEMVGGPVHLSVMSERMKNPPQGAFGGGPGKPIALNVLNRDVSLPGKGRATLEPGDMLHVRFAGGGGYGNPSARDQNRVRADLRDGIISDETARNVYGLIEKAERN